MHDAQPPGSMARTDSRAWWPSLLARPTATRGEVSCLPANLWFWLCLGARLAVYAPAFVTEFPMLSDAQLLQLDEARKAHHDK